MPMQHDQRVSHRLQALVARVPLLIQQVESRPGMEDRTPGLQSPWGTRTDPICGTRLPTGARRRLSAV